MIIIIVIIWISSHFVEICLLSCYVSTYLMASIFHLGPQSLKCSPAGSLHTKFDDPPHFWLLSNFRLVKRKILKKHKFFISQYFLLNSFLKFRFEKQIYCKELYNYSFQKNQNKCTHSYYNYIYSFFKATGAVCDVPPRCPRNGKHVSRESEEGSRQHAMKMRTDFYFQRPVQAPLMPDRWRRCHFYPQVAL